MSTEKTNKETPEKTKIQVKDHGPLLIRDQDGLELVDHEGKKISQAKVFSLCRCGLSEKKPFCDGAHRGGGFESCIRAEAQSG